MTRRTLPLVILGLMVAFVLGVAAATAWKVEGDAETRFADRVTEAYPQMDRVDAYLYAWFVCSAFDDGWTVEETVTWMDGEPADFYGVNDPAFGAFVVDAAGPVCR